MKALVLFALLAAGIAHAATDVVSSVAKLKTNEENAKENLKQYQANAEIASKNVKEADAAIAQLRDQKKKLINSGGNVEKNRLALEQVQKRIEGYRNQEAEAMKKEDAHIAKLKEMVSKLETNKVQREKNIAEYDAKIAEIDRERKNWQNSQNEVAALKKEIEDKEARAVAERDKWNSKKKEYQTEATKWEKQARHATETRAKVERLQD